MTVYTKTMMEALAEVRGIQEADLDEGKKEKGPRQLIDPNKEVMVVKKNKVVVIDKKDEDKYLKQGWSLAEETELDEAVKEYDVKIKVGSKTNSYNIMSKDELSAAQSVLHSVMARSLTGGSPGLDAVRKQFPDMKSLKKKGVSVSIKEEVELDEAKMSSSQIAQLKKAYEPMRDKRISTDNANKLSAMMDKVGKDKETLIQLFKADIPFVSQIAVTKLISKHGMKGAEINKLKEEVEVDESARSDENIKVGDNVHLGFGAKGGAGFRGKVIKIDGENVHIKNPKGKEYKGPMKFVTIGESARSDAMRAIAKDKDLARGSDVEDDDDSATDVDIKGASKNIIMQMRKAISMRGNFKVEFEDNKKIKIPVKIAAAVQTKFNSFRKPSDKEKFQAKVAKSYKSMLSALKENTILDRISKKIQERKDG